MSSPKVFLFVDNSNIFISAKDVAHKREGRAARDQVRLAFENLVQLALAGRVLGRVHVVGSVPPEERAVWQRLQAATGVAPELHERGSLSGTEQGLDQCLQVHMLRARCDNPDPQIAVLMTGDGAGYDDGVGFHADMERMHSAGWGIEVISWDGHCRRTLRSWATANGRFVRMDDHYESVTFLEGARRVKPLDLTARPIAIPRMSQMRVAEQKVRAESEATIKALKEENAALKAKREEKDRKRAKYEKRMRRRMK